MTVAERALHEMRALIRLMQEEVAKAQEKKKREQEQQEEHRKQVELQAQQEAQKKAAQSAKEKAQKKGDFSNLLLTFHHNIMHCSKSTSSQVQSKRCKCSPHFIEDASGAFQRMHFTPTSWSSWKLVAWLQR